MAESGGVRGSGKVLQQETKLGTCQAPMIPQTTCCYPALHLAEEEPGQDAHRMNRAFPVQADEMLKSAPLRGYRYLLSQE